MVNDPGPPPDPLEDLVAECLRRRSPEGVLPIDDVCARHPEHADALRRRLREIELLDGERKAKEEPMQTHVVTGGEARASLAERLRALAERGVTSRRYELRGEVARGGMGVILRAFDQDLGRSLAMKVILTRDGGTGGVDPQVLERFVEEAQITGQLDHPGVIPVHELGLDETGRAYFTMRLVRGRTAEEVFALARDRAENWTPTRAIEVLLKVCDTLAYAHSKSVVHRDLKPSNVMVGKYGEVYVMDWGLAKVLGKADSHDLRIRPPESTLASRVRTDRSKESESDPDTALRTMDGAIVGTPCYMPPEQANGQIEEVGVRSDVYAAGAMLYTLLTGVQPYLRPGSKTSPYMVLEWVRQGPPATVHKIDPKAPAELVAICERAMARSPADRYASMSALADDLRAYLEGRVVSAYRTGARAELLSWVRRNRGMAAGLATAALALVAGGVGALVYARQADLARSAATTAQAEAEQDRRGADAARQEAEAEQQKALEALTAAQAEQVLREAAESDLRQERSDLRRRLATANRRLQTKTRTAEALQRELQNERDARPNLRQWARDAERLSPLDTFLHANVAASDASAVATARREAEFLTTMTARGEGTDAAPMAALLHASDALIRREPEEALALLAESLADPLFEQARHRMVAIAHWQRGDWRAALTAHQAALFPSGVAQRNQREVIYLLCDLADANRTLPAARSAAADYASGAQGLEAMRRLVPFLSGHLHAASNVPDAPELAGRALRLQGLLGASFAAMQEPDEPATLAANLRIERARTLLAAHRPGLALAELGESPVGCVFLPQRRLHAELRALAHAMAGEGQAAERALAEALAATPTGDVDNLERLTTDRAVLLRRAGRPEEALAALLGGERPATPRDPGAMSSRTRRLLADLALQLDRRDLVASLTNAGDDPTQAPSDRLAALVCAGRAALRAGDLAAATRRCQDVARLVDAADDGPDRAACHALLAEWAMAQDRATSAGQDLARAADATQRWWTQYGRFRGAPLSAERADALAHVAARIVDCLAHMAATVRPLDAAAVWHVVETFQDPVLVAFGTRRGSLAAFGKQATDYEAKRAAWLEGLVAEPTLSATDQEVLGTIPPVSTADLAALEEQLRAAAPTQFGALLPRVPPLMKVRALLPADAAIVVFGVGRARGVAFLVARDGTELVAIDLPPSLGEQADATARQRQADAVMAPILRCRLLTAVVKPCRRLLLVPSGPLHELPLEFAAFPADGAPLASRAVVARLPSGSAWFDQMVARGRPRPGGNAAAALVGGQSPPALAAWWRGVLAPAEGARILEGDAATATALQETATQVACLGLSLPLERGGAGGLGVLRIPAGPPDDGLAAEDGLHMQSLRNLATTARLCIVHAAGGAAAGQHEGSAMAGFVRGIWAAGCPTVITLQTSQRLDAVAPLVAAAVAAAGRGEDAGRAWSAAMQQALSRGIPPAHLAGAQLWTPQ